MTPLLKNLRNAGCLRQSSFVLALALVLHATPFFGISVDAFSSSDRCRRDLAESPTLAILIHSIAEFELNEIHRPSLLPSVKHALQEAIDGKIAEASRRSGLPQEQIRHRVLLAKRAIFFSSRIRRPAKTGELQRELDQLPDVLPRFRRERVIAASDENLRQFPFLADRRAELMAATQYEFQPVALSRDGRLVATIERGIEVQIWDAKTGERVGLTLKGHRAAIRNLAFSPDGKRLATASEDFTVRVWDVIGGNQIQTPKQHNHVVTRVAFSRDGRFLASSSVDASVTLWNAKTGRLFQKLNHGLPVDEVFLSPDNQRIVTRSAGRIYVWRADTIVGEDQ